MRTRTRSCLTLLAAVLLLSQTAWAGGSTEKELGWSWDQVRLGVTTAGEAECTVQGALIQPSEPGEPALPAYLLRIQAPEGARPSSYEIVGEVTSARDLPAPLAATLKDAPIEAGGPVRVEPQAAAYKAQAWPSSRVRFLGISLGRGIAWAQFAVYPLVMEGGQQVRLLESGTLVVRWESDSSVPLPLKSLREEPGVGRPRSGNVAQPFGAAKAPAVTQRPALEGDPVDYVVLTRKNLVSAIQPFVDWKNQSGTPTVVRTVEWIDSTYVGAVDEQARIRAFLVEAYRYWGAQWLLIVGGPNEVPMRVCKSYSWSCPSGLDIITDLYYAGLDGTWNNDGNTIFGEGIKVDCPVHMNGDGVDFDPELLVGRVPANGPEQVQVFVNKYLKYVKNPDLGGYLDKFLLLGEVLFDVEWTRARLALDPPCGSCGGDPPCNPCVRVDGAQDCYRVVADVLSLAPDLTLTPIEMYEWYEFWRAEPNNRVDAVLEKKDEVIARMNEGCGIMHHVGHGDRDRMSIGTSSGTDGTGRFLVNDARAMTNADKQGILYSINCSSAAVDYDCLAEAMLFASNGGVVSYIGSTNLDFPAAATGFQIATYTKLLVPPRVEHLGDAFYYAITQQTAAWGDRDCYQRFLAFSLILLGDPQMNVWLGTPKTLAVTAPTAMVLGDSTLTVSVTRDGSLLQGASVCAYKAGDVWSTATTGANGQAVLKFRPTTSGTFALAVTHPTSVPFSENPTRTVEPSSARSAVSVTALTVDDGTTSGPTPTGGNDDEKFDEGETVKLNLTLRNAGGIASGAMTIALSVEPAELVPFVQILDGSENVASIPAAGSSSISGAFRLQIRSDVPDSLHQNGDRLPLEAVFRINEPGRVSILREPLPAYRPRLDLVEAVLTELSGGDGDNEPDNGETMLWRPVLFNEGSGTAANLEGVLSATTGGTVVSGFDRFSLGTALQDEELTTAGSATFRFVVVDASSISLQFSTRSTLDHGFVFLDAPIELKRPGSPAFLENRPPEATKDAILLTWTPSSDLDVQGYVLERGLAEGGPFEPVRSGLLKEMTFYRDVGLAGLTRYYYRVAGVDRSGNWSPYSPPVSATTNAAVLAGWPFTVGADPNSGCPTVENIDQSGPYEVFVAADHIYGLRSNAVEIIDGDGVPSTPGVWSSLGGFYWSKPAIADINGDGKVEIVATARYKSYTDTGRGALFVWSRTGTLLWQKTVGQSNFLLASPVLADIAGDTKLEVIAQNRGCLYAWNSDGSPVISANTDGKLAYLGGGNPDDPATWPYDYGSPAVANLDTEGKDEIVVAMATNDTGSPSRLIVVDGDGQTLATTILEQGASGDLASCNSSPSLADVDANGKYEIFMTTRKYLWCFRYQYQIPRSLVQVWSRRLDDLPTKWLEATPALGDVDADGTLDVVVAMGQNRIQAVNSQTGAPLAGFPKTLTGSTKKIGSAILVNLDADAAAEILVGDSDGIVHAINADAEGTPVAGFPYVLGGRIQNGLACWDVDRDRHPNILLQSEQLPQVTILDIRDVNFPTDIQQAMAQNPWPSFRHDARNTGRMDAKVITPVAVIEVVGSAEAGTAVLTWSTPAPPAAFRIETRGPVGTWEVRAEGEASLFEEGDSYVFRDPVEPGRHTYRVTGFSSEGERLFESGSVDVTVLPFRLGFVGVVPNPFRGETTLRYQAPAGTVRLDILDLGGRRIRNLIQGPVQGGLTEAVWDGRDDSGHEVASGVYMARLQGVGGTKTEKLVLLR
jgi:hypothetical protein